MNTNGITAIILAAYLAAVAYHGNADAFNSKLGEESGFIKWLIATLIVLSLAKTSVGKALGGNTLIVMVYIAMLIEASKRGDLQKVNSFVSEKFGSGKT